MPQPDAPLTLRCPDRVAPQTPFTCELRLAPLVQQQLLVLRVQLPVAVFHVSHDDGAVFDAGARAVAFRVDPLRDPSTPFAFSLIAERSAAGRSRPVTAELITSTGKSVLISPSPASPTTTTSATVAVDALPADGWFHPDLSPGRVVAAWLLASLFLLAVIWRLRRARRADARAPRRPGYPPVPKDGVLTRAAFCLLSLGWLIVMLPPTAESVRSRLSFVQTTCTVLDRGASGVPFSGDAETITDDIAEPMAAVRYVVNGAERVSTGFNVRGGVRTAWSESAYRSVDLGGQYACWYDPARPERVVLRRGPSAAAVLSLVPMGALVFGARALRRAWRA